MVVGLNQSYSEAGEGQKREMDMTRTISAKFTSSCTVCGKTIRPGDQITYDPAIRNSSRHAKCKAFVAPADADAPIRLIYSSSAPAEVGQAFREVTRRGAGRLLTLVAVDSYYISPREAQRREEDFDDFDCQAGYEYTCYCREATAEEAAPVLARETERDAKAAAAAAEKTRMETHIHELSTPPEGWTMIDGAALDYSVSISSENGTENFRESALTLPERESWTLLGEEHGPAPLSVYARLYQVGPYRVLEHGNWDDWRTAIMVPPELREAYLSREVARRGITVESATEWLAKYRGCMGTQIYEFAAGQTQLQEVK